MGTPENVPPPDPPDNGLRVMVTWVVVALIASILMAFIGVELVIKWFR
jgi:hypothetical protein